MSQESNAVYISVNLCKNLAHFFEITITMSQASPRQRLSMPTWTPGSYLMREFSQHIVSIDAFEEERPIGINKVSKNCFELANEGRKLVLRYVVYAFDSSIRAAFLDDQQAYFNGTSLFMRPHGFEEASFVVNIEKPKALRCDQWQVATGMDVLDVDAQGFGRYSAKGYEALVDYPFQISTMKRLPFTVGITPHEIVLVGDVRPFDEDRLLRDLQSICKEHIAMFGGKPPFLNYLFIARFEEGGAGGLEHRNSTMLIASPHVLPKQGIVESDPNYRQFLGLCSHEYFHAWNVKRLLPKEFVPFNFDQECYTTMLWLFEGITSYYDDLALLRAEVISLENYLEILSKNYSRLLKIRGRSVQSLAESSFDAWIKFYRQNENSANTTVSYYLKGSFVGLMLDLIIRQRSSGKRSLDDVMLKAFQLHGDGSGISESEFFALVSDIGDINTDEFSQRYIYGREELPLSELLMDFGVEFSKSSDEFSLDEKTKMGAHVGMKIRLDDHNRAHVSFVEQDGPAMEAGISPHDEIIAVDSIRIDQHTFADVLGSLKPEKSASLLIARKKVVRVLELMPRPLNLTLCKFSAKRNAALSELSLRKSWLRV